MKYTCRKVVLALIGLVLVSMNQVCAKNFTVSGKVLDAEGKPLAGAELQLVSQGRWYRNEFDLTYESGVTGPDGRFKFSSTEFVRAWILARYRASSKEQWRFAQCESFDQPADEVVEKTIRFPSQFPVLRGQVKDECDHPVAGAVVALAAKPGYCFTTPHLMRWRGSNEADTVISLCKSYLPMAVTTSTGHYCITGMPPGEYTLLAAAEHFNVHEEMLGGVVAGKPLMRDLKLRTEGKAGQISLGGKVVDSNRVGVADISIVAIDDAGLERRVEYTSKDGAFLITGLPAGKWTIAVKSPSPGGEAELSRTKAFDTTTTAVELRIPTRTVRGIVLLPNRRPLSGTAVVELQSSYSVTPKTIRTDANQGGKFTFSQVPPGVVTLKATVKGYREAISQINSEQADPVELAVVGECPLVVRVLERHSAAPLSSVEVEIGEMINGQLHWRLSGTTDGDGCLKDTRVRPGITEIRARNPGAHHATRRVEVSSGNNEQVILHLDRGCKINASIQKAGNEDGIQGAQVTFEAWPVTRFLGIEYDGSVGCYRKKSAVGQASIEVPPGEYDVRALVRWPRESDMSLIGASPSETLTASSRVRIGGGQTKTISLQAVRKRPKPFVFKAPPPPPAMVQRKQ